MTRRHPEPDYTRFLPPQARAEVRPATSTWWRWNDIDVHVRRDVRPDAPARLILIHGAGAHSGALYPLASLLADEADLLVPDLPLYGLTQVPHPNRVTYDDWIRLLCDFVVAHDDGRPVVLLGASVGGMLAYEVAARTGRVAGLAVTCLLDTADPQARAAAARSAFLGRHAPALLPWLRPVLDRVMLPITWFADVQGMSRNPELTRACASDPLGAGGRVPFGLLASWFGYAHVPPEQYTGPPILLVHPEQDAWTPVEVSERFLARVAAGTRVVALTNCGHFPVEEPGLSQLRAAVRTLVGDLTA